jgi:DNA-directed RNA polymerase specialized sigma24 family protein
MSSAKTNQELITSLQNGQEETLFYLNRKYFQSARRWLRRKGMPDSSTPEIFAKVLVRIYRVIQHRRITPSVDFETFLFNTMNDFLENSGENFRKRKGEKNSESHDRDKLIVASCYSILDENFRNLLSARYVSKLTFEEIAARFEYGNPVIAQFEVEKALSQFRMIAIARLNPTLN